MPVGEHDLALGSDPGRHRRARSASRDHAPRTERPPRRRAGGRQERRAFDAGRLGWLDPTVRLHLFDGKLVELATWAGCAEHNVGVSTAQANRVLRELQEEMEDRYLTLLANRARKVVPSSAMPLHVLVIDELAHYLLASDRKERTEFAELLRDLVARGRAAGLIVLAATQKPSHDVIPTALRDLFGFRWALRCNTPQASDTVLGSGWASRGYSASDVDSAHRGVGYLLHEGGRPVRLRTHHLDDEVLAVLAARAERLRHPERVDRFEKDGAS